MENAALKIPAKTEMVKRSRRHSERWEKHVETVKRRQDMRDQLIRNFEEAMGIKESHATWSDLRYYLAFAVEIMAFGILGIVLICLLM